jgi:hypothetical protein
VSTHSLISPSNKTDSSTSQLIPQELQELIINRHSDPADWPAIAQTCQLLKNIIRGHNPSHLSESAHSALTQSVTGLITTMDSSTSPSVSSPSSSGDHTPTSTSTELSSPEEQDWILEVTPAMISRLSSLPHCSSGATLPSLPTELQLEIFSYLDQIDSTCLGLTSRRTYTIYRAIHGTKMPLNTRRNGPNKLEAAWEVVGKHMCQHCGMYRCELHAHIKSWMPAGLEYCTMKRTFGLPAKEGASATCYRGKPSKPRRCGRHPVRT